MGGREGLRVEDKHSTLRFRADGSITDHVYRSDSNRLLADPVSLPFARKRIKYRRQCFKLANHIVHIFAQRALYKGEAVKE